MKILRLLLLLLLAGGVSRLVFGQTPVILTDAQDEYSLGQFLDYLEDPTGALAIDDVASPAFAERFVHSQIDVPNFGYTASAYWVHIRLHNSIVQSTEWRLELGFANMQQIEFYRPDMVIERSRDAVIEQGQEDEASRLRSTSERTGIERSQDFDVIRTGTRFPFATREIPYHRFVFPLTLPPEATQTIYLRLQNEAFMTFPLTLWSPEAFMRHSQRAFFLAGLFYGALLVLSVYNAFLWLALRDHTYRYYVGTIASAVLIQGVYEGWAGQYLWPDAPRWTEVAIPLLWGISAILAQIFAITFLNTRAQTPREHGVMLGFIL